MRTMQYGDHYRTFKSEFLLDGFNADLGTSTFQHGGDETTIGKSRQPLNYQPICSEISQDFVLNDRAFAAQAIESEQTNKETNQNIAKVLKQHCLNKKASLVHSAFIITLAFFCSLPYPETCSQGFQLCFQNLPHNLKDVDRSCSVSSVRHLDIESRSE